MELNSNAILIRRIKNFHKRNGPISSIRDATKFLAIIRVFWFMVEKEIFKVEYHKESIQGSMYKITYTGWPIHEIVGEVARRALTSSLWSCPHIFNEQHTAKVIYHLRKYVNPEIMAICCSAAIEDWHKHMHVLERSSLEELK